MDTETVADTAMEVVDNEVLDTEVVDNVRFAMEFLDNEVLENEVLDNEVLGTEVVDMEVLDNEELEKEDKAVQTEWIQDKVDEWLDWDKNEETLEEMKVLLALNGYSFLKKLLLYRLQFDPYGLRGRMGAGFSRMNDLVVIQTTQGLVSYLESAYPDEVKQRGVVIGFDARNNSRKFAELTAVAFLSRGIRVFLFSEICPSPFVPYCITINNCLAGIMITASHLPKHDNGYKLYWENGVQIMPSHAKVINAQILENLEPWENAWDRTVITKDNTLLKNPLIQISGMYFKLLRSSVLQPEVNKASQVKITHTALHGVGHRYMREAFKAGRLNPMFPVKEQRQPNPNFPTLEFPNPEEESALALAFRVADEKGSKLILATDPDGDRLAVAEKGRIDVDEEQSDDDKEQSDDDKGRSDDGDKGRRDGDKGRSNEGDDKDQEENNVEVWRMFTGGEVATLLCWWAMYSYRQRNPSADLADVYVLGTVIGTTLLQTMAQTEGFSYEETPVGFKWVANRAYELTSQGKTVVFAYDEPLGFMVGPTPLLDKDGISAGLQVASLAAHLEAENLTLGGKLEELSATYGYHICLNSWFLGEDGETIKNMFERLRNFSGEPGTYPESVGEEGAYAVVHVRDYTTGYDSAVAEGDEVVGEVSVSEMIRFVFDNGVTLTVRQEVGDDPKVKYYTHIAVPAGEEDVWSYSETLQDMVEAIVEEFFQPELNGLTFPSVFIPSQLGLSISSTNSLV